MSKKISFIGKLERINFPKHTFIESGEPCIIKIRVTEPIENTLKGEFYTLKGTCCQLYMNDKVKINAVFDSHHAIFGDSYKIEYSCKIVDLKSVNKQKLFLSQIISEKLVDSLYAMYDNPIELLENSDINSLVKVKGIGNSVAEKIVQRYMETKDYSGIYSELANTGISIAMINKIVKHYGSPDIALKTIKENPYNLVNITGIGFKKADEIAIKSGMSKGDERRIKGCIIYILTEQAEIGKSYLSYEVLYDNTISVINEEDISDFRGSLKELIQMGVVLNLNGRITLKKYYDLECKIADEIKRLVNTKSPFSLSDELIVKRIAETELKQGFSFDETQLSGIKASVNNNVIAITGGAGCGKTSTAKGICDLYPNSTIIATALSGRASLRITEATGYEANTIHRTIGIKKDGSIEYNKDNPIKADIVLIDEATMISGDLMLKLLNAIPNGCKLIVMGDIQQLSPIGNCQVFADILNSNLVKCVRLTEPHRQALKSGIISSSYQISKQNKIFGKTFTGKFTTGELKDMEFNIQPYGSLDIPELTLKTYAKELKKYKNILDVHIITPLRERGNCSCITLNKTIQKLLRKNKKDNRHISNNKYDFYIGDKVINTKNNYITENVDGENSPIFNGSIGVVKDLSGFELLIKFSEDEIWLKSDDIKNLDLGYATTIHKTQGSEFKSVIVAIDTNSYIMQNCELLYTAITRAKEYCTVISTGMCITNCIGKKEVKQKQTFLKELLNYN